APALQMSLHVVAGREGAEVLSALLLPLHGAHEEPYGRAQHALGEGDGEVRHHAPPVTVSLANALIVSSSTAGVLGTSPGAAEGSRLTCLPSCRPCSSMTAVMSRTSFSSGTISCGRMPRRSTAAARPAPPAGPCPEGRSRRASR